MRYTTILAIPFILFVMVAVSGCAAPGGLVVPLVCAGGPCPDLVPVVIEDNQGLNENNACNFCNFTVKQFGAEKGVEVFVKNRGGAGFYKEGSRFILPSTSADAPASVTRISFKWGDRPSDSTTVDLPTPALPMGFSVSLGMIEFPTECTLSSTCKITVKVDADNNIGESDEGNNAISCGINRIN